MFALVLPCAMRPRLGFVGANSGMLEDKGGANAKSVPQSPLSSVAGTVLSMASPRVGSGLFSPKQSPTQSSTQNSTGVHPLVTSLVTALVKPVLLMLTPTDATAVLMALAFRVLKPRFGAKSNTVASGTPLEDNGRF